MPYLLTVERLASGIETQKYVEHYLLGGARIDYVNYELCLPDASLHLPRKIIVPFSLQVSKVLESTQRELSRHEIENGRRPLHAIYYGPHVIFIRGNVKHWYGYTQQKRLDKAALPLCIPDSSKTLKIGSKIDLAMGDS